MFIDHHTIKRLNRTSITRFRGCSHDESHFNDLFRHISNALIYLVFQRVKQSFHKLHEKLTTPSFIIYYLVVPLWFLLSSAEDWFGATDIQRAKSRGGPGLPFGRVCFWTYAFCLKEIIGILNADYVLFLTLLSKHYWQKAIFSFFLPFFLLDSGVKYSHLGSQMRRERLNLLYTIIIMLIACDWSLINTQQSKSFDKFFCLALGKQASSSSSSSSFSDFLKIYL